MKLARFIPNILTFTRFVIAPFIVYLAVHQYWVLAFCGFSFAFLTDLLDGEIARRFNCISRFGQIFDSWADSSYIIAAFFGLFLTSNLSFWFIIICYFQLALTIAKLSLSSIKSIRKFTRWFNMPLGFVIADVMFCKYALLAFNCAYIQIVFSNLIFFIILLFTRKARIVMWVNSR